MVDALHHLDCRWCLLRDTGVDDFEYDVLVDGDPRTIRRALTSIGARPIRSWGRAPHRQFLWWCDDLGCDVRLDLVDRLAFGRHGEFVVDRRDAMLATVTERGGWPRPAPSTEQWAALLHALLDRDRLRPIDRDRLTPWVGTLDDPVADALPEAIVADLTARVAAGDWAGVEATRDAVTAALAARNGLRSRVTSTWRSTWSRTTKLQRAVLRPGARVALLGPDGAGKSTTIASLVAAGVVDSSVYLGVAPADRRRRGRVPGIELARTVARLHRGWWTATVRRRRGRSVALDRHPLEARIGPPTTKATTRARRWILSHVLPRPELVVVLTAPTTVLHHRKPEHPPDEVDRRRARYLDLAEREGFEVIDTTQDPEVVVRQVNRALAVAGGRDA